MFKRLVPAILVLVALLVIGVSFGRPPVPVPPHHEAELVWVANFPNVTRVEGTVGIDGPIKTAASASLKETLVSPVAREKTTNLIDGGVVDLSGFSGVVLSLAVETKGELGRSGNVGALLVPEETVISRAFREDGETLFAMEVEADLDPGRSYFASRQPDYTVSFPRYRVYYYNTTDKSVAATLFLYANGK